jgi:dsRNA-specific ribonuclease
MELKVQKDNKLGETVEALFASISISGGVQEGYEFLRRLGIMKTELSSFVYNINNFELQPLRGKANDLMNSLIIQSKIIEVEKLIDYDFKNKHLLMQAFIHRSYCDHVDKEQKVRLPDYNLLEFLGDSVMNFFVVDFFYRHSNHSPYLRYLYGHDQLHKLKSELTNNNFLSMMMIEMGLHTKIQKKERVSFNAKFDSCV